MMCLFKFYDMMRFHIKTFSYSNLQVKTEIQKVGGALLPVVGVAPVDFEGAWLALR